MWTAIQRAAGHCSVVLTTHHLEEVEALADIVAIMVDGAVQCFGDAAYLKGKYGRVLESQVTVAAPDHLPQLRRFMKTVFPQGACVGGDRRRFVFHLPYDRPLGEVFAVLHEHCVQLHITSYTVAQTSIEETFERVKRRAGRRGRGETLHSSEIVAGCARVY
ncbi:hypothetical protein NESM_000920700 [Novymonas esmeraldas]|uniref:ABC transporter n=1 Tax=Novymonas esmeraldas TaxID=1808958 RepID=A0AAW0EZU0_9TRYP